MTSDREGRHGIKPDALIADRVTMPLTEYQRLIEQLHDAADRADAAEARMAELEGTLRDFADHGIRTDCNPTLLNGEAPTAWWCDYLRSADRHVRRAARAALAPAQGETGVEG